MKDNNAEVLESLNIGTDDLPYEILISPTHEYYKILKKNIDKSARLRKQITSKSIKQIPMGFNIENEVLENTKKFNEADFEIKLDTLEKENSILNSKIESLKIELTTVKIERDTLKYDTDDVRIINKQLVWRTEENLKTIRGVLILLIIFGAGFLWWENSEIRVNNKLDDYNESYQEWQIKYNQQNQEVEDSKERLNTCSNENQCETQLEYYNKQTDKLNSLKLEEPIKPSTKLKAKGE